MIVVLETGVSLKDKASIVRFIESQGGRLLVSELGDATHIGLVDTKAQALADEIRAMPGVATIRSEAPPYPQVSRQYRESNTVVEVRDVAFGGEEVVVIAGPCSVESAQQVALISEGVAAAGARMLRGGAFKPRTSPYSFQGMGEEGLLLLATAREQSGLPVVTEVMDPGKVEAVAKVADILQIGARNAQNYPLLKAVGATGKPVLLKRGIAMSIQELLLAAEYVLAGGGRDVVLCERGIRTFETSTRFTLDLSAVPVLKRLTHLPVIVDPSHAAGDREYVEALALAALAAGADGLIVEVHGQPERALCDGAQALRPDGFARLMERAKRVAGALEREL